MQGWMRYKNDADPRIRERFKWEVRSIQTAYSGLLWAMERQLPSSNAAVSEQIRALRKDIECEFGTLTRAMTWVLGPLVLWTSRREQKRLAKGKTYEPKTIVEHRNWMRD